MLLSISILFSVIVFSSCCGDKEEPTAFEAFSTEVFAYDLGDGWEINASTRVKGFVQNDAQGEYSAKISYTVDLLTPEGKTIKDITSGILDKNQNESFIDLPIEAQFELDSSFVFGNYKIILNLKDEFGNQTTTVEQAFVVGEE